MTFTAIWTRESYVGQNSGLRAPKRLCLHATVSRNVVKGPTHTLVLLFISLNCSNKAWEVYACKPCKGKLVHSNAYCYCAFGPFRSMSPFIEDGCVWLNQNLPIKERCWRPHFIGGFGFNHLSRENVHCREFNLIFLFERGSIENWENYVIFLLGIVYLFNRLTYMLLIFML